MTTTYRSCGTFCNFTARFQGREITRRRELFRLIFRINLFGRSQPLLDPSQYKTPVEMPSSKSCLFCAIDGEFNTIDSANYLDWESQYDDLWWNLHRKKVGRKSKKLTVGTTTVYSLSLPSIPATLTVLPMVQTFFSTACRILVTLTVMIQDMWLLTREFARPARSIASMKTVENNIFAWECKKTVSAE